MNTQRTRCVWLVRIALFTILFVTLGGYATGTTSAIPIASSIRMAPALSDPPVTPTAVWRSDLPRDELFPSVSFFPFVPFHRPDLAITGVQVIQGTAVSSSFAVYIADRPTVVRAYVSVDDDSTIPGVTGRMDVYNEYGTPVGSLNSNVITTPSLESNLNGTLNFYLPPGWTKPGYSYSILLDPNNTIPEMNENNNRYPSGGTMAFNFVTARPLQVVIIPILYLPFGTQYSHSTRPETGDFAYLKWMPDKVLPIPFATFTSYYPYGGGYYAYEPDDTGNLNDSNGWFKLLQTIEELHRRDGQAGANKIYYGLVNTVDAHGCPNSCYTGMGYIGEPNAVGWSGMPNGSFAASKTMTHEIGHTLGREHVLCSGAESEADPFYPYNSTSIGVWGLDVATGTLYNPNTYADFMSYCDPVWTSDYTYRRIQTFRDQHLYDERVVSAPEPAFYVGGLVSADGRLTFDSVYRQVVPVRLPAPGTHTLELLGAAGQVLAAYPFTPTRIGDSAGAAGFGFFVPVVEGLDGLRVTVDGRVVGEKSVPAPLTAADFPSSPLSIQPGASGTVVRWSPVTSPAAPIVYGVRLSQDGGATYQVLALDWHAAQFTLPPGVALENARLEVQATDGIHVTTRVFEIK